MKKTIAVLAGDGIGPEVMKETVKVLRRIAEVFGHEFKLIEGLIGGAAWEKYGEHFSAETKKICENSDAILFGSVGGPVDEQMSEKWRDCEKNSILVIRKHFNFNVNFRPVKLYLALKNQSVLRASVIKNGVDILCVRELSEDVYFGEHKTVGEIGSRTATDLMIYDEETIEKVAIAAFSAAMKRRKKISSVDKANVLDCSKLWREVVSRIARNYPECSCEHVLVDNMAMQLIKRPSDFDVILMPNMFGDIISDEVSVFAGSLGMLPSASLNSSGFGLYEPSGGSAPDIAGRGIANPIAQILSMAMMLKYSFGLDREHDIVQWAVSEALKANYLTADIAGKKLSVSTSRMGDVIANSIYK